MTTIELFGAKDGELLLLELFGHAFADPEIQMRGFLAQVEQTKLPFDLMQQLRKLEFPGYPSFECGLPSSFYYFVPDSGWGSAKPYPADPLDKNFVNCTDGFGLNLGCPLRLKRALEILDSLAESEKKEATQNLANTTKHLATVEELLWLDIWKRPDKITRSEGSPGRTHDWIVVIGAATIRQECKHRPVDWARLSDGNDFKPMEGFLLGKATKQLPNPPEPNTLNIVGVTGMKGVDDNFRKLVAGELSRSRNVEAIIYRSYANEIAIFSLNECAAQALESLVAPQQALAFQPIYHVFSNIVQKEQRRVQRAAHATHENMASVPVLFERGVKMILPEKKILAPMRPHKIDVVGRLAGGEPQFKVISPF